MSKILLISLFLVSVVSQGFCAPTENAHKIAKRQIYSPMMDFGRPIPSGPAHGAFGGMFGSPIFGPPFMGPFNNPVLREMRIKELYDHNRKINGRPTMDEQFSLGDYDMYDYGEDHHSGRRHGNMGRHNGISQRPNGPRRQQHRNRDD